MDQNHLRNSVFSRCHPKLHSLVLVCWLAQELLRLRWIAGELKKLTLFNVSQKTKINQTGLALSLGTFADSLTQLPPAYMNKGLAEGEHTPGRTTFEGLWRKTFDPTTKHVTLNPTLNVTWASVLGWVSLNFSSVMPGS